MKGSIVLGLLLFGLFALVDEANGYKGNYYTKKKNSNKKKTTPSPSMQPTEEDSRCVWTGKYLDRDDPSGTGDYELIDLFGKKNICNGKTPVDVSCVSVNGEVDFDDYPFGPPLQYEQLFCEPEAGFLCVFSEGFSCPDFKVQFCCPVGGGDLSDSKDSKDSSKKGSSSKSNSKSDSKSDSSDSKGSSKGSKYKNKNKYSKKNYKKKSSSSSD